MDENKVLQPGTTQDVAQDLIKHPRWPKWPTSVPGPHVKEPPPGQRRDHHRTEQMIEVGYNQETGEPEVYHPERSLPPANQKEIVSPDLQKDIQQ